MDHRDSNVRRVLGLQRGDDSRLPSSACRRLFRASCDRLDRCLEPIAALVYFAGIAVVVIFQVVVQCGSDLIHSLRDKRTKTPLR